MLNNLLSGTDSVRPENRIRAWVLLTGFGLLSFSGYLAYAVSLSELWLVIVPLSIGMFLIVTGCAGSDDFIRKQFSSLKLY